jgi:phenylpropionate dioxygenase-like ring-hydroxylating dioxygenase large terminal subunit
VSDYPKAVAEGWHPVAAVRQLGGKPLARRLMDRPIVVFRTPTGAAVLTDRCPHRNMALSSGRLRGGEIECPYHGWRFAQDGRCTLTPGAEQPSRHGAEALPVVEREGLVWTTLARQPAPFPVLPDPVGRAGFDTFWWPVKASRAALIDAVENLLDPAHPHFLHAGIVRSATVRRPVEVVVRTSGQSAEAIYVENARASALMPRLLEGLRTTSVGRFFAPSIGQIAFEGPDGIRLAITVFFTPETAASVRPFAHFATPKGRAPAFLKQALLRAFHVPVLAQDRAALSAQMDNLEAFGGPRYALGPLDFLRPAIQALANGETLEEGETKVGVEL